MDGWIKQTVQRVLSALCSLCCVDTDKLLLQYWSSKWKDGRAVVKSSWCDWDPISRPSFHISVLTSLPVLTEQTTWFCTINVFHLCMSVPVPGQVLEDPASVWRVHYSGSAKILFSDTTVERTKWHWIKLCKVYNFTVSQIFVSTHGANIFTSTHHDWIYF